ncbi:hypothetical protein RQP46_001388 [Phenoliferia psychrophenolica]
MPFPPPLPFVPPKLCDFCSRAPATGKTLLRCGRCKMAWHCSGACQHSDWSKHSFECSFRPTFFPQPINFSSDMVLRLKKEEMRTSYLLTRVMASWSRSSSTSPPNANAAVADLEMPELTALLNYTFEPDFLFTNRRIPSDASDPLARNRISTDGVVDTVNMFDWIMKMGWGRACAEKIVTRPRDLSEGEYHHIIKFHKLRRRMINDQNLGSGACQHSAWSKHSFECSFCPTHLPEPIKLSKDIVLKLGMEEKESSHLLACVLASWSRLDPISNESEGCDVAYLETPELTALLRYTLTPESLFTDRRIPSDPSDPVIHNRFRRLVCALACVGLQTMLHYLIKANGIDETLEGFNWLREIDWGRACAEKIVTMPRDLSEGEYHHIIESLAIVNLLRRRENPGKPRSLWEDLSILKERLLGSANW